MISKIENTAWIFTIISVLYLLMMTVYFVFCAPRERKTVHGISFLVFLLSIIASIISIMGIINYQHQEYKYVDSYGNVFYVQLEEGYAYIDGIMIKNTTVHIPDKITIYKKEYDISGLILRFEEGIENQKLVNMIIPNTIQDITLDIYYSNSLKTIAFDTINEDSICLLRINIRGCDNLQNILLPACKTIIESLSITSCPSLERIDVPGLSMIDKAHVYFKPGSTKTIIVTSDNELIKQILSE